MTAQLAAAPPSQDTGGPPPPPGGPDPARGIAAIADIARGCLARRGGALEGAVDGGAPDGEHFHPGTAGLTVVIPYTINITGAMTVISGDPAGCIKRGDPAPRLVTYHS